MSDVVKNRAHFKPGQSGNPKGRPRAAEAASEIARGLVKKYQLWERLARTAAGEALEEGGARPTISEQTNAARLLLAYGWGSPVQMQSIEGAGKGEINIQVTYVQQNRIEVSGAASGPGASVARIATVQCLPDGAPLGQIDAGPPPGEPHRD